MRERIANLHPSHKQLVKFLIVGGIATLLDWGIYYTLTRHVGIYHNHVVASKASSSILVSIYSFFMNRYWSFRKDDRVTLWEVGRFYIAGATGIGINVGATYFFVHVFNIFDLIAVALATLVTVSWNFTINKFWVFKK